jgi:hypothetical protein
MMYYVVRNTTVFRYGTRSTVLSTTTCFSLAVVVDNTVLHIPYLNTVVFLTT